MKTLNIGGIKCDAPGCTYRDNSVHLENYDLWLNKPCPLCGANLLTQADYNVVKTLVTITKVCDLPVIRHVLKIFGCKRVNVELNGTGKVTIK
jgi:hypothetical protein